jgi:hypothetical protein
MKLFKPVVFSALVALFYTESTLAQITTGQTSGQDPVNTISTALPFLLIAPDSRAGAMGDAGVATEADVNSAHWNPAKMVFNTSQGGFGVSYSPWLRALIDDINLAYVTGYYKPDDKQAIGASLLYFDLGNIVFTNLNGDVVNDFNPYEVAFDVNYSRRLSDYFSAGAAVRFLLSNLATGQNQNDVPIKAATAIAVDLGGYYEYPMNLRTYDAILGLGFNFSNIGTKVSYTDASEKDFIPTNMRLGACYRILADQYNEFGFTLDVNKLLVPTSPIYDSTGTTIISGKDPNRSVPSGIFGSFNDAPGGFSEELREFYYAAGVEYWYDKQFAVRAGYFYEHPTKGNRKYFTAGAGLRYNVFNINFSYLVPTQQRNPLENTLRFSLLFNFGDVENSPGYYGGGARGRRR